MSAPVRARTGRALCHAADIAASTASSSAAVISTLLGRRVWMACRGEVHGPEAVLETAVDSTRVYIACEPQLPYVAKSLEPWVAHQVKDKIARHS
ncbi:MAG: hypothetical protein MZV63_42845 [Marinilabiliales bacterium]|nr:hypothetical protein [Marinilabiliales bacterium]